MAGQICRQPERPSDKRGSCDAAIAVARRAEDTEGKHYDLARASGGVLVENIARRRVRPLELLREIDNLKSGGYGTAEIAKKIEVTKSYVSGITHLLKNGKERLLYAWRFELFTIGGDPKQVI